MSLQVDTQSLLDGHLQMAGGAAVPASALAGKIVAFYFSAHWCAPCRAFTPTLIAAYNAAQKEGLPFELVFVSADHDQEGFDKYTEKMPWPAVKFESEDVRTGLGELFEKKGIPMLYIVGADGALITREGRQAVAKDKEAAIKAWTAAIMPAAAASAAAAKPADAFTLDEDF